MSYLLKVCKAICHHVDIVVYARSAPFTAFHRPRRMLSRSLLSMDTRSCRAGITTR